LTKKASLATPALVTAGASDVRQDFGTLRRELVLDIEITRITSKPAENT
jgi:hypothetical protein